MKRALIAFTVLIACCASMYTASAQSVVPEKSLYFKSGQFRMTTGKAVALMPLIDSFKKHQPDSIELQGNADNIGSSAINNKLSKKRAEAVKAFLISHSIAANRISVKVLGPGNPIASNKTKAGRQKNRRVDIFLVEVKTSQPTPVKITAGISTLLAQLEPPAQLFCIDRFKDTIIRCKQGTLLYIKANSFLPVAGCDRACVSIRVKEVFSKSDMLFENVTTTAGADIIESQGMLYTEAVDCNGNQLTLENGKDMMIVVPTDSINPTAKIFDGNRGHDSIMNWTVNNTAELSEFTLPELDLCGLWLCGRDTSLDCRPCPFLFCKIGRVGKAVKGLVNSKQRAENIVFRRCQQQLKTSKKTRTTFSATSTTIITKPPLDSNLLPKCQRLDSLFKRYGVQNIQGLILAINKPLLDRFKLTTIEQLRDTLAKINTQKIELSYVNKKISFNDYKFYVYNASRLGWSNVDCFINIPNSKKSTVKVNLKPEKNIDCKLVFKYRRSVVPATKEEGRYEFKGVPKGEQAFIVAVKFENGQPFLGMQEITISNNSFNVEFKALTLPELKAQLRLLDREEK